MADWQSAPAVSGPGTPSQDSTPQWQSAPAVDNATPAWKSAPPAEPNVPNVSEILRQQTTPAGQEPTWKTAADAHIQSLESGHDWVKQPDGTWIKQQVRQPGPLSTSEKLATYYAYQNQQGYGQTPMQEPGQAMAQDRAQTQQAILSGQGDYQNFANAANQSLAGFGTNVVGAFDPQLGQQLQQNVQAAAPFNPESSGGTVGSITGQVLPLIPAMVSGQGPAATMTQLGTAGAAGAGQFGAVREDVANRRSQGQQISKLQEFGNAGLQAATMFLANKFGMGQINKGLPALTAAERASLQTVVAQHVATAMQNAGVTGSDFAAMQMANNIIDRVTGVAPDKDITEGVGQALGAGIATGGIATGLHAMNHPTSIQEGVPVPSQQTLDSLKITPPKDVTSGQGNPKPTEPNAPIQSQAADKTPPPAAATPDTGRASGTTGRTLIDTAEPTYRVHNGAESQGVPLEFQSPEEKALFLATVPRKGKVANEAIAFLQERGFKPEAITRYGDELRSRLDGLAKQPPAEGHPLYVPMLGDEEATPTKAPGLPQEQGAGHAPETAPFPLTPEKDHAAILAERNPGAKLADTSTLPTEHQQVLSDYKQLTGRDMIPYSGGKGRGFHLDGDAYYSVDRNNTPQRRRETIAHEATHALQDTQPQLVASLDRALPDSMRQSLLSEYQEMYKHQEGKPLSTDQHNREIQAMAVGRAFARPSVANAVMQKNPGAFSKAAGAVIRTLRNLTKTGRATNEIVSFLQQAKAKADAIEQPATRRMPEKEVANYLPQHSQDLRDQAEEYTTKAGLPYEPDHEYAKVDEDRAKRIAAEYSSLKHEPGNPDVKRSYDAFKHETLDQWNYLKDKGVKFEAWQKPGQPYKNSEEMSNDVRNNQHLYFFQGGDLPQDHPLADNAPGTPYTYNDVFRAVHDYFGHAKEGYGFGPRGEENAWRSHSQMYSEAARPAMTTETRGQNSWVNFGPHGEANQKNPADTTYAEQKAGLLPRQFQQLESAAPAYPGRSAAEESLSSYAKDKAGFNQPAMAGSYLPDYKPKNKENQKNLEELKTHLTPEEYDSLNTPEAKRAVELLKTLPPDKEFAEAIKAAGPEQSARGYVTESDKGVLGRIAERAEGLAKNKPAESTKAQQPLFLPGSGAAKSFIDEDVKPVLKAVGERFSDAWDGVKSVFAPQARSEQAGQAARLMRERGGYLARQMDRVHAAFDESEKALDKLPVDQQRAITDAAERGQKQADPALQPVADAIRQMYDDRLANIKRLNPSFEGLNDYMGHLYKDPDKAVDVLNTLGRAPLEGNKGFLRQRTIPYQSDAIAKGLEPVTDNPVSMMKLKLGQMDKYIATQDTFDQMKANGLLKRVPARKLFEEKQNGYEQIDDKVGTIFAKPNRKGGVSIAGYWMAPEPVARVINNYLSPGIRGNPSVGGLYQTYLGVGHALNSVQLLSGFHLMFSTIDTMASKLGLGFRQAWGGDFKGAAKSTASWASIIHPVIDAYRNGNAMMKEWYKPGSTGKPDIAQAVDNYMIAGGRMHMGRDEYPSFTQSMKDAAAKGNYVGAAARSPLAAIEQISKPLMEHLIPRLKAGVFYDMAMHEIQTLPPTADRDAVRKVMSEAQDSVDDRLGEMVYDNTFWHHTAKDLLMATTRSVGWNAGTFRTFGGAAIDLAKLPGAIASNKGLQGVRLSNRLAYAAAVPLTTALVGSIMHYAATGQPPQTLKDAIFPKTGKKTKQGDDERWAIPSYVKDLAEYGRDISDAVTQKQPTKLFRTLGNKTNPVLNTMLAMLQNHDYYGVKIRNEDDPAIQQLKDVGSYLGKQVQPFGIRGVQQMLQEGQGARSILPLIGLNPARKDVTESPAALRASELVQDRLPHGLRTKEQAEKSRTIGELASAVGRKEPDAGAKVRAAVEGKQITPDDFSTIRSRSKFGSTIERNVHALASRGHLDSAMQVWDIADDTERRKLLPILTQAVRGAKSAPIEERKQYMATLMAGAKRLKAALPPATAEE